MRRLLSTLLVMAVIVCGMMARPALGRAIVVGGDVPSYRDLLIPAFPRTSMSFNEMFASKKRAKVRLSGPVERIAVANRPICKYPQVPLSEAIRFRISKLELGCQQCPAIFASEKGKGRGWFGGVGVFGRWIKGKGQIKDGHVPEKNNIACRRCASISNLDMNLRSLADDQSFNRYRLSGKVGSQLAPSRLTGFPKGPDKEAGSANAKEESPKSILSSIRRGIRSFPLGAKVAVALVSSIFAARILFGGFIEVGDGRSYRTRGLLKLALGGLLLLLIALFWWVGSPY